MTRGLVVTMLAVIPVIGLSACATPTAGTATPAAAALTGAATRATTSSSPPPPAAYVPAVVADHHGRIDVGGRPCPTGHPGTTPGPGAGDRIGPAAGPGTPSRARPVDRRFR